MGNSALGHEPAQVAVGGDVVETMIVHADMGDVDGHVLEDPAPAQFQEARLSGRLELQKSRTKLKALRPLGPTARRITPAHGEHGRAVAGQPTLLEAQDLGRRKLEQLVQPPPEGCRSESRVDLHSDGDGNGAAGVFCVAGSVAGAPRPAQAVPRPAWATENPGLSNFHSRSAPTRRKS